MSHTWVKAETRRYRPSQITLTQWILTYNFAECKENQLAFVVIGTDRKLEIEVHRKPAHTNQYLLFYSHHPLHKLEVIRTQRTAPLSQKPMLRKTGIWRSRRMAQHKRSNTSGPDSVVSLHLKDKGHSFMDQIVFVILLCILMGVPFADSTTTTSIV